MREQLITKRLLIVFIIMTMLLGSTLDMIGFADVEKTFTDQVTEYLQTKLEESVTASVSVEPSAETGKPFKMNVRIELPRILTYKYQQAMPAQPMYDEYKDVKVVIPLPEGVTAVDPSYVRDGNLVIEFPKTTEHDFEGETDKSKDIMLKVLNNGTVADGTVFTFEKAKWHFVVDMYDNEEHTSTTEVEVEGDISPAEHKSAAGDSWGIEKKFIKTEEIGSQVVFSFDETVGMEGADENGNKFL